MSRPTVYTSFDGDQMIYIDCMRKLAIRNGLIPINPEHALGYYLSTRAHGDSKAEVMKDCLSLVTVSDEFWVFTENENAPLETLSEGILIEILLWIRQKSQVIKFFSIAKTVLSLGYGHKKSAEREYHGKARTVQEIDLKKALSARYFEEISTFLEKASSVLRPVIFIDIRNEDFKYADWARYKAYQVGKIPIVPQYLIPEFVYALHGTQEEYPESIEKLKEVSSGIWAIYESQERLDALREMYKEHHRMVTFIPIKDLNVPKYANPRNWSITTKELQENLRHD